MKLFLPVVLSVLLFAGCNSENKNLVKIAGEAQGTTWHISYVAGDDTDLKPGIDSILRKIDSSMSTYLPVSIISRINKNESSVVVDQYFMDVFNKAHEVSEKTGGLFDVTVGSLVNAWGFGFTKKEKIDSSIIDSLLQFVGYTMLHLQGNKLVKAKPQVILDFNAIAQGYSVDVLASYLENIGIENYLVELGGELKAKGKKYNEDWKVGIDQPEENSTAERKLEAIISLNNKALCTSGNYRKFYEEDGKKYAHILDPRNGYPAKQNILSATVIADDAITADAYATSFMVMGLERSKEFLSNHKELNLEVYFIYDENGTWKTYASESLEKMIEEVH